MTQEQWNLFRCPKCRVSLQFLLTPELDPEKLSAVQDGPSGGVTCDRCGETYTIRNGIPRFVPNDGYTASFGMQWNLHRRAQLDSHTGLPISRTRLLTVTGWPPDLSGQSILEAGSGAGRFTEVLLATGAQVHSFDYSAAVEANFANNGHHPNLALFQGDIFRIPLPPASFDKVMCLGVLQHTPDPEGAFQSLSEMVKAGGELVIDVYAKTLAARLQWKYVLRPITRGMDKDALYRLIERWTPRLIPMAHWLRAVGGRTGARLVPIVEYSHLGLSPQLNQEWAILDTFDMYSPAHDHPQDIASVRRWFEEANFAHVSVRRGPNGVIGKGRKA